MSLTRKRLTSNTSMAQLESWAFKVFCASTVFIVIFSTQAIYIWHPVVEKLTILFACALPAGMIIFSRAHLWLNEKKAPKEFIWILLVSVLGLLACLFSDNQWVSLKSMVLFLVSGPFIFIASKYILESKKNQEVFLWMMSFGIFALGFIGVFEHFNLGIVYLFSRNPLPAGALLLLLSAGPLVLLNNKDRSLFLNLALVLSLALAATLIVLMAKKSHLLGLAVLFISLIIFVYRKYFKFLLGFIVLTGLVLIFSEPLRSKYKNMIDWYDLSPKTSQTTTNFSKQEKPLSIYGSIPLRAESYIFGYHVFKKNPVWGLGFKGNFDPYFADYNIRLDKYFSKNQYRQYIKTYTTFENIAVTYLVEWGSLFSFTYFGGLIYIVVVCFKRIRGASLRVTDGAFVVPVIIGFAVVSLTFDTLRFPNLNWMFHSLLGLLVNLPSREPS